MRIKEKPRSPEETGATPTATEEIAIYQQGTTPAGIPNIHDRSPSCQPGGPQ